MPKEIDYKQSVREVMAEMLGVTGKAVGSTPTASYGHGLGGLFSYPGLSRPVFSALILPRLGLQSMLPVRYSNESNPLYGIFTGVTASSGDEPDGPCDDPPVVGLSKLCMHSFVFGRQSRMTPVFEIDRMGLVVNRGEFTDLQFLGDPYGGAPNPNKPTVPGAGGMNAVLNTEVGKAMFEMGVAWSRDFAGEIYTGNPANNSANGGRKYAYGLDILINTGYQDAETAQACPAADSIVRNMNSAEVNTNGKSYVDWMTNVLRRLQFIASRAGLSPVSWVLTMRWSLFYQLTEIWPCAYATYRCDNANTFGTSQVQNVDTQWMIEMRDSMRGDIFARSGQYLMIDGQQIPVIIDDGIAETALAGSSFSSTIYFVPLTVLGGTPVTFLEHINYDGPAGAMEAARAMAPADSYQTSDSGRFLWHKKPPTNFCVQMLAKTEPRILVLTPHVAARLTNVKYTPLAHERDWDPDGSFYVDGGRTARDAFGPSFYAPTS